MNHQLPTDITSLRRIAWAACHRAAGLSNAERRAATHRSHDGCSCCDPQLASVSAVHGAWRDIAKTLSGDEHRATGERTPSGMWECLCGAVIYDDGDGSGKCAKHFDQVELPR